MLAPLLAVLLFQQPAASPVARIVVTPANPTVVAGDTLRLRGEAVDSAGQPVPNATVRFFGGGFEGHVDATTGVVQGGFRGMLVVRAVASVPGFRAGRPQLINVQIVSPPAARIVVTPAVSKMMVGQRLKLTGSVLAGNGDSRDDDVHWTSSAPRVVRVEADGRIAALAPGAATITATVGGANQAVALQVSPNTVRRLEISGV